MANSFTIAKDKERLKLCATLLVYDLFFFVVNDAIWAVSGACVPCAVIGYTTRTLLLAIPIVFAGFLCNLYLHKKCRSKLKRSHPEDYCVRCGERLHGSFNPIEVGGVRVMMLAMCCLCFAEAKNDPAVVDDLIRRIFP